MDDQNILAEIDLSVFDGQFRELLFELQRKKILLEECRHELSETILKQQELERELISEKNKNNNDDLQTILLKNAVETLEEERQKISKELVKIKVHCELAMAEKESLRKLTRSQCIEMNKLKRQVEDLESKQKCQVNYQNNFVEQLNRLKSLMAETNETMQSLRKKQEDLQQSTEQIQSYEQALEVAKQLNKQKTKAEKEKTEIENLLIIKTAELSKLHELLNNFILEQKPYEDNNSLLNYWKTSTKNIQAQLNVEKENNLKLTNALKLANKNQDTLEEKNMKYEEEISKYKNKMNNYEEKVKKYEEELRQFSKTQIVKFDQNIQTDSEYFIDNIDLVKSESY